MHKTENHHDVYQKDYKENPVAKTWGNCIDVLPTRYHQEITNLERKGWPPIATKAIIDLDKWVGNI